MSKQTAGQNCTALAQMRVSTRHAVCHLCKERIAYGQVYLMGCSKSADFGYASGIFCAHCWLSNNYSPENEGVIKMNEELLAKLGIAKVRKFAEVAPDEKPWKYVHTELVNEEVVILGFVSIKTKYGTAFLTDCIVKEEQCKVLIGGEVLMSHLEQIKNELPIMATIVHNERYYQFI